MPENCFICSCCGKSKPINQRILLGGDALCYACVEEYTTLCDRCGERVYRKDVRQVDNRDSLSTMLWTILKKSHREQMLSVGFSRFEEEIMFENPKYITRGVQGEIPDALMVLMANDCCYADCTKRLSASVTLTKTPTGQHIVHTQEQPPYRYELDVHCKCAVDAKVYVIDGKTHGTMLLASEY